MIVRFKKLDDRAVIPTRAKAGDAGYDVCALDEITLAPGQHSVVPTGIALELPDGVEVQVRPRSGLAAKHAISLVNAPGTIDSGYRGDIGIILINLGKDPFTVEEGMRIAQLVFNEYLAPELEEVDELSQSDRGEGSYGSTGT